MSAKKVQKNDEQNSVETTGHEWDGIQELNNPMPAWWLWTFYASCAFALLWSILYPAWPLLNGATPGLLDYSSRKTVEEHVARVNAENAAFDGQLVELSFDEIFADSALNNYAVQGGAAVFRTYCSQCHGSGAAGSKGYPNLTDDDWLWGGNYEEIHITVSHGIRDEADNDTHISEMPGFGDVLEEAELTAVVNYVLSLSGEDHDAAAIEAGSVLFADNCSACHSETGAGDRIQGAPNLTDKIWLHGEGVDGVTETVTVGRNAVMPKWAGRLSDAQLKQVTMYVHQLGGGE